MTTSKKNTSHPTQLGILRKWLYARTVKRTGRSPLPQQFAPYYRLTAILLLVAAFAGFGVFAVFKSRAAIDCKAGVWSNLEACGWPGATNTGANGPLEIINGTVELNTNGQILENKEIHGTVFIRGSDVTIRNVKVIPPDAWPINDINHYALISSNPDVKNILIEDCEIDGVFKVQFAINTPDTTTVRRCEIKNAGEGIQSGSSLTFEDNYCHDMDQLAGYVDQWHVNCYISSGVVCNTDVVVRHNTIKLATPNGTHPLSGTIQIFAKKNVLIENNLLANGSYPVYINNDPICNGQMATASNLVFKNNFFSNVDYPTVGKFGIWYPLNSFQPETRAAWSITGNTILETGEITTPEGLSPVPSTTPGSSATPAPTPAPSPSSTPAPSPTVTPSPTPTPVATPSPMATPTNMPYTIKLNSLTNNQTVSGLIPNPMTVVSPTTGVAKVSFYQDGALARSETTAPYCALDLADVNGSCGGSWDTHFALPTAGQIGQSTTLLANGNHTIEAKAYNSSNALLAETSVVLNVSNATPSCTKRGDVNCDGKVSNIDLNIVLGAYGTAVTSRATGDLTGDGVVNVFDLSQVLQNWGR